MHLPRPEDRVALLLGGSGRYVDAVIRLLTAGVFPIPLDPKLTAAERDRILGGLEPTLVLTAEDELTELLGILPPAGLPLGRPMHCTSGTTGTPKGVYSGLLDDEAAAAVVSEERELWGFADDDVHLVLSPLHHSAPLRFAMGTTLAGGRVVGLDELDRRLGFDPERVTQVIRAERPTTMFCVPTHLQRLFSHWDAVGVPDLSSFRLVAHAGAPCPPDVKRRLLDLFPPRSTWEFYGSTEGQFTACRSEEQLEHPGTVGRARPGRRLTADDDHTLWCVVPEHARFRYFNAPEKTAAAWRETPDGPAFTVGDHGRIDENGYVYLEGRREDLIITGGVNVYPAEVEAVLSEHPDVTDVAVYGVPDDEWGHRVCAAVVGDVDAEDLRAFVRERLTPAKRPKTYRTVDAVPRTSTGKVQRLALADEG